MALSLEQEIGSIKNEIEKTKTKFVEYIKDKSIPLEKRWEFFRKAPNFLKEQKGWVENFESFKTECNYYDDFYKDRYQTVDTCNLVETVEEDLDYKKGVFEDTRRYSLIPDQETLDRWKEEILSNNLGSFINDW